MAATSPHRRAGAEPDEALLAIEHLDGVEGPDVDDDPAVVRRPPADPVPAAAHRERHVLRTRERERLPDALGVAGPQHEPGGARVEVGGPHTGVLAVARLDGRRDERRGGSAS